MVSHILLIRERMEEMTKVVEENVRAAQSRQKKWYNQTARDRELQPDEVLVLLPTCSNKLLAQWQGPYRILCRVGKVNYEVLMPDKRKRRKVFHINMLKKWYSPVATSFWSSEDMEVDEEEFVPTWQYQGSTASTISDQLSEQQKGRLSDLLAKFRTVMSGKCGWTTVCQHHIRVKGILPFVSSLIGCPTHIEMLWKGKSR